MTPGLRVTAVGAAELVLTRSFDAPAAAVFAALTEPALLRRWHGARGWRLVECEVDLRPGGAWRFVSRGPGGAEMTQSGVYREVSPPGRLVQTEVHGDWLDAEAVLTTVLEESDERTTMTVTARYPSAEIRDTVLRSPMERGAGEGFDKLTALLNERCHR